MATAKKDLEWITNEYYDFKENSPLHAYLLKKQPNIISVSKNNFRFSTIGLAFRYIINDEQLFDIDNPMVIICDTELETAFKDMPHFHLRDLVKLVKEQVFPAKNPPDDITPTKIPPAQTPPALVPPIPAMQPAMIELPPAKRPYDFIIPYWANSDAIIFKARQVVGTNFDKQRSYVCPPGFLSLIRSLPGTNQTQTIYSYHDLCQHISKYITLNQNTMVDNRNMYICITQNTYLESALNVGIFDRCQIAYLISYQLMLVAKAG